MSSSIRRKAVAENIRGKLLSQGIGPQNFESVGKLFGILEMYGNLPEDHQETLQGSFDVSEIDRVLVYHLDATGSSSSFVRVVTREEARRLFSGV